MRSQHIKFRLEQQLNIMEFIINSVDNLISVGTPNITPFRVGTHLTALREHWEKFSIANDALSIAMMQVRGREKERLLRHKYFQDKIFWVTQELYLESVEKMTSFLNQEQRDQRRSESVSSTAQSSTPMVYHGPRLPILDIPKYDGTPSEWFPFQDLFDSIIVSNPCLSSVQKLQYLKMSLIGTAASFLKNTALTAENLQKAWTALTSFYENKRLLVNSALHSLITLKRMTKESATEMEQLYTSIMQTYRTLETLQRPVHTWDDFLVFIAVQRLDSESVKAWEHHLGSSKDPPTWKQFSEFLMTRILSLQAFEKSGQEKPVVPIRQHHAKIHHAENFQREQTAKSSTCPLCSDNHYVATCPQFSSEAINQKIGIIKRNHLCHNCLGRHRSSSCLSTKRCSKCGKKHHSSIHQAISSKTEQVALTSTPDNVEVNHASVNQTISVSSILLATAQVVVISEQGQKSVARALIDPGSQTSFITERLAQRLNLPRQRSSAILRGIGAVKVVRPSYD